MSTTPSSADMRELASSRYAGDVELMQAIRKDPALTQQQKRADILRTQSTTRMRLLANAMRVCPDVLPDVAGAVARVQARVDVGKPLEAFVFADSDVNAFVTEGSSRFLVALSSGAVQVLSPEELEFVIGHELGHALYAHTEVAAGALVESDDVSEANTKLLRSWQRAAEISADRVGLLACGDPELACTALVKTLAGLPLPGARFAPSDIASQWESLLGEMMDAGATDLWQHSHPFLPLRIKALDAFWTGHQAGNETHGDPETRTFLAMMEAPGTRSTEESGQGLLARFLLWGGLYVGLAEGSLAPEGRTRLNALTVPGVDLDEALAAENPTELALAQFRAAKTSRRTKLRADELSSILRQLVSFAALDNHFSDPERERLGHLARELGLGHRAIELLIEQHQEGTKA